MSETDRNSALDDAEGDDRKPCFPCPFCYVDIEVTTLCIHLQEEHCFDFKNAVSEIPNPTFSWAKPSFFRFQFNSVSHQSGFYERRMKCRLISLNLNSSNMKIVCSDSIWSLILAFAISGLPSMCSKSWERCNWTFYGSTCKLLEGINCRFSVIILYITRIGSFYSVFMASGMVYKSNFYNFKVQSWQSCHLNVQVIAFSLKYSDVKFSFLRNPGTGAGSSSPSTIKSFLTQMGKSFYLKWNFYTLQHRRKSQKSGFWTSGSAMLGKELLKRGREDAYESAPDPLLSPFICSLSIVEPKGVQQDECSVTDVPVSCDAKRYISFFYKMHSSSKHLCNDSVTNHIFKVCNHLGRDNEPR